MVLPCFAGIANSILGGIVERVKTEVTHLLNYSSNVEELRCAAKDLSDGMKSIEEQIAEADNSGLSLVDSVVKGWQEKATSLDKEAAGIISEEDRSASPTCLLGLRLNLWACYLASKKSIAAKEKAVKLREEAKTFVRVATIDYSNTYSINPNTDFDAFKSREIVSNNIVEALKNPNVHMVGVYGMGGLGKTTLAEKVSEQLHKDGTFKHVVMAFVSPKPDVIKIQQEIADQLRIKLDATTDKERARQLKVKLEKREKLLIVLDDVWDVLEFNLIGIPFSNPLNQVRDVGVGKEADTHQTSSQTWYPKILMTSRNESLLKNGMGSTCNFELQILSYEDAWNLFQNTWRITTAGIPQDCLSIASEVVKKCSGLPVLLVIVAKALRTRNLSIWRDALRQLESFEFDDSDEVYKKIELSYNYLKSDEIKSLFRLFGQLDPHYTTFSDLLKYTTGLGLFKGCKRLEQARDRLHRCLNDLKGYGLLQDVGNDEGGVIMHDVVHKFAVYVGYRDHHMLTVPEGDKLEEWPGEDDLEAIALRYCYLPQELPASFHAPKLASFLMFRDHEDDHPLEIPDKFFVGMKGLKLLDLTCMSLSPVLPSSLTGLVKLQTLCLNSCELDDIAIIGELTRLQVLCLQGSSIRRLPIEIGRLDRLKLLDLNNCSKLKEIASERVLSKLTSLEELCMKNSFKYWEKEIYSGSSTNAVFKNASLRELKNLPNLISLHIHIPHAEMLPKDLFTFDKLERFRILTGEGLDWRNHDFRNSRTLKLKLAESPNHMGYGVIKALMGRAEDVYLQQLNGFESLCELDSQGFPHMKHLNVQKVQIQYVVNSISSCVVFPKLESLVLKNLTTLQKIICHATAAESWFSCFQNLQSLTLDGCEKITYLFMSSMVKSLAQLKKLEVSDCKSMKEIVFTDTSEEITSGEIISFPNLDFIQLKSLLNLKRFCNISNLIEFPSLAHLCIEDCPELRTFTGTEVSEALFDEKVAFPNLEELKITNMGGLKMIWGDAVHPSSFFKLKTLRIEKGSALLTVFSSGMMSRALNLESLIISECESLIEVFNVKMLMSENKLQDEVQETQLKTLHISKLPKLKHMCNEDTHRLVSFQNLESVSVQDCDSLTSLFPISVALGLHQLKELTIDDCGEVEEIVSSKEEIFPPKFVFSSVTSLELLRSPKLKRFYPGSHTSEWPILNNLFIHHCDKIDLFGTKFQNIQDEVCKDEEQLHTQVNQQPFLCFTKIMPNLEQVSLRGMDMEMIYDNASLFLADKVQMIELSCFHDDSQVFPIEFLQRFQNLIEVVVLCSDFKQLFSFELLSDEANVKTLARIPHLSISLLNEMTHIWNGEFDGLNRILQNLEHLKVDDCKRLISLAPSNALFPNLTCLVIAGCKQLVHLITSSSTIKSLANLMVLQISECVSLIEIVASDDEDEATSNIKDTIVFPKLEHLSLQYLASLTSFCSASDCIFVFPSLVTVIVAECPKMKLFCQGALSTPKLIHLWVKEQVEAEDVRWEGDLNSTVRRSYLEMVISHQRLTLSSDPVLQDIWHNELPEELFSALRFLEVVECTFVTYAISSSLLRSMNNLEELRVTNNKSLEEVFDGSMKLELTNGENVLSELREFYLVNLPSLMHVCPENLEGVLDFKNLTSMDICNCSSLRYVFTTSMALCLVHIRIIEVKSCAGMEAIILHKENDDNIPMILPQLTSLLLESLHSLSSFYTGNGVLESPCLEKITFIDCPKMETFTSPSREVSTNGENQETIGNKALFNNKVVFPNLEELKITKMGAFNMIWGDALHPRSFFKLKTLEIVEGSALLSVFSTGLVSRALNLERLMISECESLIELFDVKMLMSENKLRSEVLETQLKTLDISNLPKLKHLWNEDTHGLVSFQNLELVSVFQCPCLTSIFPVSVALGLHQLISLRIDSCEELKEIVSNKEDIFPPKFVFSNATSLQLWRSPKLKRFYPGSHTSEWPILNNFSIQHCDNIDLFGTKIQSIQGEVCKDEEQPFLCLTEIMQNLEEVTLRGMDVKMIYDNDTLFLADKVKGISLQYFDGDSQVFPLELLQRFPNFNTLYVWSSAFEQLFPSELLADEANVMTLARIRHLIIDSLNEMTHIWGGEFEESNQVLQNLESLSVCRCDLLIILVPSNALFPNLTYLVVDGCEQLVQLITSSSTVKSLSNLTYMKISQCDSLTEIVANGDAATRNIKDTIVFPKLERLTLQYLGSLTSFCSAADCNFVFPSLVTIIVAECPKMKFFCQGALSTLQLKCLWVKPEGEEEEELRWEGDLNSTVRQSYIETVTSQQRLTLSSHPVLQDMWHELPAELFSALRFLEVDESTFVTYVISSSLLRSLNNLEELFVANNNCLEEIFENVGENVGLSLSELREFYLVNMPSLIHVCPENLEGVLDFKNLTLMVIQNCSSLRYVFTASMALCLVHIQEIQVKNCDGMEAIILNKENDDNILMVLPQLRSLLLESLHCLSSFYSGNGVLESPKLRKITITDCPKMETFTSPSREVSTNGENEETIGNKALFNDKVAFPNLEELKITQMSRFKMIWADALHPTSFFKLKSLEIEEGSALLTVFSSGMMRLALNLWHLTISECESLIKVFDVKTLMSGNKLQSEVLESQLKSLNISNLPKLKHLWNEDTQGLVSYKNLDSVWVKECPSLTSIFPISVALGLHRLRRLRIDSCEGMKEIVLNKEMQISECDSWTEIVASGQECEATSSIKDTIVFPELGRLTLQFLPSLTSFCSATDCSFDFPSLDQIIVAECPKMKLFCHGGLSTPMVTRLWLRPLNESENELHWEGDLNSTVRKFYIETVFEEVTSHQQLTIL